MSSLESSARGMEQIVRARDYHDRTCVFGELATGARMNPADMEKCGWEEGDRIAGIVITASDAQEAGSVHILCPGQGNPTPGEEVTEGATEAFRRHDPVYA